MKFLLVILLTAGGSFLAGIYLPWWSIALAAFIVAFLFPQRPFAGFVSAFLSVFILWFVMDYYFDLRNDHILSHRMASLILHSTGSLLIILVSSFVGALVSGMAGLSGCLLRGKRRPKKSPSFGAFYSR
jgi:hypothetical protein